jgi:hypothetical protein
MPMHDLQTRILQQSRLVRELAGVAVCAELLDQAWLAALRHEALQVWSQATRQESDDDDGEDWRGGKPKRRLFSSGAGPVQDALYHSVALRAFLDDLCGAPLLPSGSRGSYSYYLHAGDYLDVHRDIGTCDVTLISCLHDVSAPNDQAGALVVYPDRASEPLSVIRRTPDAGAYVVKLAAGQSVVLAGGIVPHRVLPVRAGQSRTISALCFAAAEPRPRSGTLCPC